MLWTILVILLILWLLGFLSHVGGGLIHILLIIAVIFLVVGLIRRWQERFGPLPEKVRYLEKVS